MNSWAAIATWPRTLCTAENSAGLRIALLASRTEWLRGVLAFPRAAQVVAGGMKLRSGLEASWKKSRICPPLLATVCLENAETVFRCPRVSAPWMSYSNVGFALPWSFCKRTAWHESKWTWTWATGVAYLKPFSADCLGRTEHKGSRCTSFTTLNGFSNIASEKPN